MEAARDEFRLRLQADQQHVSEAREEWNAAVATSRTARRVADEALRSARTQGEQDRAWQLDAAAVRADGAAVAAQNQFVAAGNSQQATQDALNDCEAEIRADRAQAGRDSVTLHLK